jgi:hypothetical protein
VYTRFMFVSYSLFHPLSSFPCDFVFFCFNFVYRPFSVLSSSVWSDMDVCRLMVMLIISLCLLHF